MKRAVIKIGTKVLSNDNGTLDVRFLKGIVAQVVKLRALGVQVIIVTSGAVGARKSLISLKDIESNTVEKQIFAAIGQVKLMTVYAELFSSHSYLCAQVLATKEDFRDECHYLNMQNCFEGLLLDGVVPIVNENDVVATTELLFTDNDELAGLVAKQLNADALIILTSTDGILDDRKRTIPEVNAANADTVQAYIQPNKTHSGRGGMFSKFATASQLAQEGTAVHILNGRTENVILSIATGQKIGTTFVPYKQ